MKVEKRNVEKQFYIAEDGTEFENELDCAMYEQLNPYNEFIKNYEHLDHIMFFNQIVEGFFCNSQEDIDNCCNWFMTNYKNSGKNVIAVGRFFTSDYYLFISDDYNIDTNNYIASYIMLPSSLLKKQWEVFLSQIPNVNIDYFTEKREDNKLFNKNKEYMQVEWLNEFLSSESIHEEFKTFLRSKLNELENNITEETNQEQNEEVEKPE